MSNEHATIVAVVSTKATSIQAGGAPVFIVSDTKELQKMSMSLEKILDAAAHTLNDQTIILVAR